jgi:hypothetical protein
MQKNTTTTRAEEKGGAHEGLVGHVKDVKEVTRGGGGGDHEEPAGHANDVKGTVS